MPDNAGMDATIAVLTGAGLSTESGIPDFRGPGGLWRTDPEYAKLVDIANYLADPDIRRRAWRFRAASPVLTADPNPAHHALVRLEREGALLRLITQNIDGLHQKAGSDAVLELHGNVFGVACVECRYRTTLHATLKRVDAGEDDPHCPDCGGIIKTTTVMFGELLDGDVLDDAVRAARDCATFIAAGSSLAVEPAASLVAVAADAGARIIIANRDATHYDFLADEIIRDPLGEALPALVDRLLP
jgi:NAD-dependent deacetylase